MSAQASPSVRSILAQRDIRAVIGVQFVFMLGLGLVFPLLPLFARSFGVSLTAAGAMGSAFGLTRLCADLAAGPAVDRYGERTVALVGMGLLCICAALTGLAPVYPVAVIFWAVGGIGSAITFAAQYSYLLKVVPRDFMARTLGVFYGSFNAGIVAGGVIGGTLAAHFGLRAPFFLYSAVLAASCLLHVRLIPRRRGPSVEPPLGTEEILVEREASLFRRSKQSIASLFRRPGFVTAIALNFAYLWMVAAILDTLVPLFADGELGLSTAAIGGLFGVAVTAEFAILYPAGALSDRYGRKPVLIPALIGLSVLSAVIGLAPTVAVLVVIMAFHGLASGFAGVPPAAMLSDVVPEESSGMGVGVFRFAGDLAFFMAPTLSGAAAQSFGFKTAFMLSTIPLVLVLLLVMRTPETLRR